MTEGTTPAWKTKYLAPVSVVHDPETGQTVKTDHHTGEVTRGGPELMRDSLREAFGRAPRG